MKLKEGLIKIVGGGTPSKSNPAYWSGDVPWATVKDMADDKFSLSETKDHISDVGLKNSSSNLIPAGTVITSTRMGLGRVFINKVDVAINQDLKALFTNEKLDNHFLLWAIALKRDYLNSIGSGTTVKGIRLEQLRELDIPELMINKQKRVAGILQAYDNLIENNSKRIHKLESIARLLYRHKIQEIKTTTTLGTKLNPKKGKNITKATIIEGWVPVVAGGLKPAYFHIRPNTISPVITVSASGANAGFVNLYYKDIWASDCTFIDKSITPFVYYYFTLMKERQYAITHMQKGSAQPHVYPADLERLEIPELSDETIVELSIKLDPIYGQIRNLTLRNEKLANTRDMLLPRLMTGENTV